MTKTATAPKAKATNEAPKAVESPRVPKAAPKAEKSTSAKEKAFNKRLEACRKSLEDSKRQIHGLLIEAMDFVLADKNTEPLARVVRMLHEAKNQRSGAVVKWALHHFPALTYRRAKISFGVKKGEGVTEMEIKVANLTPYWDFEPETKPNPYRFTAVGAALRKARKEAENLSPEDKRLLSQLEDVFAKAGRAAEIEPK